MVDLRDETNERLDAILQESVDRTRAAMREVFTRAGAKLVIEGDSVADRVTELKERAAEQERLNIALAAANAEIERRELARNDQVKETAEWRTRAYEAEASVATLTARVAELEAGLRAFANVPSHGAYGGPLVTAKIIYEDETEARVGKYASLGHEPFSRARALLQPKKDKPNG